MHTKKLLFIISACGSMFFSACSKENPATPGTNTTDEKPVTPALLCSGTTTTRHFFPLRKGNSWTTDGGSGAVTRTITKDTVIKGKTYFVLSHKNPVNGKMIESYFRSEVKGDIYEYRDYDDGNMESPYSKEYLYLPGDADVVVGDEWKFPGAIIYQGKMNTRKITSANGSVKTSKCDYTGLVVVTEYDPEGKVAATYYFKRSLGKVRETAFGNQDLTEVVLK